MTEASDLAGHKATAGSSLGKDAAAFLPTLTICFYALPHRVRLGLIRHLGGSGALCIVESGV